MDIKKLYYECLTVNEQTILMNIVIVELSKKKTDILRFVELHKDDMVDSIKHALKFAYTGRYHGYQCTYIEDLDLTKMTRYSGFGLNRFIQLEYLIKKHKNSK